MNHGFDILILLQLALEGGLWFEWCSKAGDIIHHPKAALFGRHGQAWSAGGQRGDYISIPRAHCRQHPALSHLGRLGSLDSNRYASNCILQTQFYTSYALQVKGQTWLGARFARHMWPSQYQNSVNQRTGLDFWVYQISNFLLGVLQKPFQSSWCSQLFNGNISVYSKEV